MVGGASSYVLGSLGGKMAKYFKDVVQDSHRTGLGIPVETKNLSLEPMHRPQNRLSALNFARKNPFARDSHPRPHTR